MELQLKAPSATFVVQKHALPKIIWHTGIPGLWTQGLDAGILTPDSGHWTVDIGCWTLDAGL